MLYVPNIYLVIVYDSLVIEVVTDRFWGPDHRLYLQLFDLTLLIPVMPIQKNSSLCKVAISLFKGAISLFKGAKSLFNVLIRSLISAHKER